MAHTYSLTQPTALGAVAMAAQLQGCNEVSSKAHTTSPDSASVPQSFVRSCLLAIGRSPGLARRLNVSSTLLQDAFVEYFNTNRARPPINENQIQTPPLQLVFRHDCMCGSGLSPVLCWRSACKRSQASSRSALLTL